MIVAIEKLTNNGGYRWVIPSSGECHHRAIGVRTRKTARAARKDFDDIRKAKHIEYRWPKGEKP